MNVRLRALKRTIDHTRRVKNKWVIAILIIKIEEICPSIFTDNFFRKFPVSYEKYYLLVIIN